MSTANQPKSVRRTNALVPRHNRPCSTGCSLTSGNRGCDRCGGWVVTVLRSEQVELLSPPIWKDDGGLCTAEGTWRGAMGWMPRMGCRARFARFARFALAVLVLQCTARLSAQAPETTAP